MFVVGIDLASRHDFTAVSVVERRPPTPSDRRGKRTHACIHLDRWRGKYTETVPKLATLANVPSLRGAVLVCDQTGVGSPVVDMLREALPGRRVLGVNFTAGRKPTRGEHKDDWNVPKALLVAALKVLLGERRLTVSRELKLFQALTSELKAFQAKKTEANHETYGAARERDHDDLVSSLMLASWLAENTSGPPTDAQVRDWVLLPEREPERDGRSAAAGEYVRTRADVLAEDHPELFGA